MALFDFKSKFCDNQDISGGAGSTVSTDSVNLTADDRGEGTPLTVHVQKTVEFAGGTSVQIAVQHSPDNSTWEDLLVSEAFTLAELNAAKKGILWRSSLPSRHEQYLQLNFTRVGIFTAGSVTAGIVTP